MEQVKHGGELAAEEETKKENELSGAFKEEMEGSATDEQVGSEIEMKSCNSSNVYKHGFIGVDPQRETGTLAVEFKGGSLYHYIDVPSFLYEEMCECESVGKFINSKIKNNYAFKKVEKVQPIEAV